MVLEKPQNYRKKTIFDNINSSKNITKHSTWKNHVKILLFKLILQTNNKYHIKGKKTKKEKSMNKNNFENQKIGNHQ